MCFWARAKELSIPLGVAGSSPAGVVFFYALIYTSISRSPHIIILLLRGCSVAKLWIRLELKVRQKRTGSSLI